MAGGPDKLLIVTAESHSWVSPLYYKEFGNSCAKLFMGAKAELGS